MGLKDLFKPEYNHSNPTIRSNALESINEEAELLKIVLDAEYPDTWKKAIEKVNDVEVLRGIILGSRKRKRIDDLHLRQREAIKKVTDPTLLKEVAKKSFVHREVRREAVQMLGQLKDTEAMLAVIEDKHADFYDAIEMAIRHLSCVNALARLIEIDIDERFAAYKRRDAQRRLDELKTIALADLSQGRSAAAKEYFLGIGSWLEKIDLIEQLPNEEITKEILQTLSDAVYSCHGGRISLEGSLERILLKMQAAGWKKVGEDRNHHLCKWCNGKKEIWRNLGSWNENDVDGPYECGHCDGGGRVETVHWNYSKHGGIVRIVFAEGKLTIN